MGELQLNNPKLILSAVAILSVAACGGGGSSGGGNKSPSYNQLMAEGAEFAREYNTLNGFRNELTPVSLMPTTGKAHYSGVGAVKVNAGTVDGRPQVAGRARLTANFDDSRLSGNVKDFKAASGHSTTGGEVRIRGDIVENVILGNSRGMVNIDGRDHEIDGELAGVFLDDDADAIAAASEGFTSRGDRYSLGVTGETD